MNVSPHHSALGNGQADLPRGFPRDALGYAAPRASIRDVLFAFGDDARVYPGHGPSTTIGQERRTNPFLVDVV